MAQVQLERERFDQNDDDGIVILLDEHPPIERLRDVLHAAHTCPGQAITVTVQNSDESQEGP